jgi:hypothetical protein
MLNTVTTAPPLRNLVALQIRLPGQCTRAAEPGRGALGTAISLAVDSHTARDDALRRLGIAHRSASLVAARYALWSSLLRATQPRQPIAATSGSADVAL